MDISTWISIISLVLLYVGGLVSLWIKLNIKIAEINTKAESRYLEFKEHCRWGEEQQKKNEHKFEALSDDIRQNQKEMLAKLDTIQEKLNQLAIYVERNVANKK